MMIVPPTGSPSTIEMALAARRIRTRGLAKKRRKADQSGEARLPYQAVRAMETQSPLRLGGSQPGWELLRAGRAGPAGAYPRSGPASCPVFSCAASPLNSTRCQGLTPPARGVDNLRPDCTARAKCLDAGSRAAGRSICTNCQVRCRFCTWRQSELPGPDSAPACALDPRLHSCIAKEQNDALDNLCDSAGAVGFGNGDFLHRRRADSHPVGDWFGSTGNPPDSGTQCSWLERKLLATGQRIAT